jgi:uncharacterized protein YjbI with pentapeptide repeats
MQRNYGSRHKSSSFQQRTMPKSPRDNDRTRISLKRKSFLQFAASLFIQVMLGIFTLVVTFYQQNGSDRQRIEDSQLAREQREQDLNLSHYQRAQDQEQAYIQREQDLNTSRLQREFDLDAAEQRRQLDLNISQQNAMSNLLIAEKQRNMTEQQRAHEINMGITRRREHLLISYIKEVNMLIEQYNGTPTKHPLTAIVMRAKTLTLIRQLDPGRNAHVVRFLYAAGLLTDREHPPPLDLSEAELDGIDLSGWTHKQGKQPMHDLSLAGAYLRNASFTMGDFSGVNFSRAILIGAHLNNSNFTGANFAISNLFEFKARSSDFTNANFSGANMSKAYLQFSILRRVQFTPETLLDHADLSYVSAQNVSFVNMSHLSFTLFIACACHNTHFDNAVLVGSDFSRAILDRATFTATMLDRARLVAASVVEANFIQASMSMANCTELKSSYALFCFVKAPYAEFRKADLSYTSFKSAAVYQGDFSQTIMRYASLPNCKLMQTRWTKSDLFAANLSLSNLTGAFDLTDEQLFTAVSIYNTFLPNGTIGRKDPSLLRDGSAVCNTTFVYENSLMNTKDRIWMSLDGQYIIIRPLHNNSNDCVYALAPKSPTPILLSQVVGHIFKYYNYMVANKLVLLLSGRFGNSTIISLVLGFGGGNVPQEHILSKNIIIRSDLSTFIKRLRKR